LEMPEVFFIPNGSKMLVTCYAQLRRDRLAKYIAEFNSKVREVFRDTGDIGIEGASDRCTALGGVDSKYEG
jgi:hypothetical protein